MNCRGIPSTLTSGVTRISATYNHTCAVQNGAAYCWGYNANGGLGKGTTTGSYTPVAVTTLTSGITEIQTTRFSSCAIYNGSARCWGENTIGKLGNGNTSQQNSQVQVSGLTSGVTAISMGAVNLATERPLRARSPSKS
jgi:alpha-tubulin suppressor-like RCC1 family protein